MTHSHCIENDNMFRLTLICVLSVCSLLLGCHVDPPAPPVTSKRLLDLARRAKSQGRSSIETSAILERDTYSTLDEVLVSGSVLLATHEKTGNSGVVGDSIVTPHEFRVVRWLRQQPSPPELCNRLPVSGAAEAGFVVTRTFTGTVRVEGVKITATTDQHIVFDDMTDYLFFVGSCPNNRILLAYGDNSVFTVSADGTVAPASFNTSITPFVTEVEKLHTLSALEARLSLLR